MIRSATGTDVSELLARVVRHPRDFSAVTLCSPFIDGDATAVLKTLANNCERDQLGVRVLTNRRGKALLRSASVVGRSQSHVICGDIRNLHAKVYVAIGRRATHSLAIVTSANLTRAGMNANVEFGVLVSPTSDAGCKLFGEIVEFVNGLQTASGRRRPRGVHRGLIR